MAHTKVTKAHSDIHGGAANTYSYSGSFDTFKATEVVVTLDAVKLTYTASTINDSATTREYTVDYTAKTVHIGGADLSSGTIVIKPETDLGSPTPRANYSPGSSVTSEDLNNNQLQLLRRAMEYEEQVMFKTGGTFTGSIEMGLGTNISFEGATDDAHETTLTVVDPTADRTITLPNITGTVVTTGDTGTVTATMLAANSVDSSELVDASIDTSHIGNSQVTTAKIADNAVTSAKLPDDVILNRHFTAGVVAAAELASNAVTTAKIAANAVTTAKIADDAITSDQIANNAVHSENIVDGTILTADLANNAITTGKIENNAVDISKIGVNKLQ
jgi:hypothetical protein